MAYDSEKYARFAAYANLHISEKSLEAEGLFEDDSDRLAFREMKAVVRSGKELEIPSSGFL